MEIWNWAVFILLCCFVSFHKHANCFNTSFLWGSSDLTLHASRSQITKGTCPNKPAIFSKRLPCSAHSKWLESYDNSCLGTSLGHERITLFGCKTLRNCMRRFSPVKCVWLFFAYEDYGVRFNKSFSTCAFFFLTWRSACACQFRWWCNHLNVCHWYSSYHSQAHPWEVRQSMFLSRACFCPDLVFGDSVHQHGNKQAMPYYNSLKTERNDWVLVCGLEELCLLFEWNCSHFMIQVWYVLPVTDVDCHLSKSVASSQKFTEKGR